MLAIVNDTPLLKDGGVSPIPNLPYKTLFVYVGADTMPFKSGKQKRWMWANKPKLARKWTKKYGSKPRKKKKK